MLKIIQTVENELHVKENTICKIHLTCGKEMKVYEIKNVHQFIQFVGYGKYINNGKYNVYLRGQTGLFNGTMKPSLYRGDSRIINAFDTYNNKVNSLIESVNTLKNYPKDILEPLLQHYGVKTNWLDLVDNMWIALWFACHDASSKVIESREYVYFSESNEEYAYIYLIATDAIEEISEKRGIYKGDTTISIDLRKGAPSFFLRPHAQHAIMIRKKDAMSDDYTDLIVGIAKIPMTIAKKWIGNSELLAVNSLFPAPHFDEGYALLLKDIPLDSKDIVKNIGSIQIVSGD